MSVAEGIAGGCCTFRQKGESTTPTLQRPQRRALFPRASVASSGIILKVCIFVFLDWFHLCREKSLLVKA